jgi:L-asparaginase
MQNILILSVGGTFNKYYDPLTGTLEVDPDASALHTLVAQWNTQLEIQTLIGKDSLEMDDIDRLALVEAIRKSNASAIVVVHGTDTLDHSAAAVAATNPNQAVIFTGAMIPFSIDPVEATANLASAVGWAQGNLSAGVYVAMHGVFGHHNEVVKDRQVGRFVLRV